MGQICVVRKRIFCAKPLRDLLAKCRTRLNAAFKRIFTTSYNFFSSKNIFLIMNFLKIALKSLNLQKMLNVRNISKKFDIVKNILRRQFKNKIVFYQQTKYFSHNCLFHAQKKTLIIQINRLIDRDISSTTKMMKNFGKNYSKICKQKLNKKIC